MEHRPQKDNLASVMDEVRAEKAAALGRTGRLLEQALARVAEIDRELADVDAAVGSETTRPGMEAGPEVAGAHLPRPAPPRARAALTAARRHAMDEAGERFWYLMVQREALGLRDHERIASAYGLPPGIIPGLQRRRAPRS